MPKIPLEMEIPKTDAPGVDRTVSMQGRLFGGISLHYFCCTSASPFKDLMDVLSHRRVFGRMLQEVFGHLSILQKEDDMGSSWPHPGDLGDSAARVGLLEALNSLLRDSSAMSVDAQTTRIRPFYLHPGHFCYSNECF